MARQQERPSYERFDIEQKKSCKAADKTIRQKKQDVEAGKPLTDDTVVQVIQQHGGVVQRSRVRRGCCAGCCKCLCSLLGTLATVMFIFIIVWFLTPVLDSENRELSEVVFGPAHRNDNIIDFLNDLVNRATHGVKEAITGQKDLGDMAHDGVREFKHALGIHDDADDVINSLGKGVKGIMKSLDDKLEKELKQ